jgi:hypothetical protein
MTRESGRHERAPARTKEEQAEAAWQKRCFTLEINRRPVLSFSATSLRSARARMDEPWFTEELGRMRSNGRSILLASDCRSVRLAHPDEIATLLLQRSLDEVRGEDVKYCFAFLVQVDTELN